VIKIVVVEDEKPIAKLLKYNLEQNGYIVLIAQDGEAGLALIKESKPDLILLDLMLPKIDGIEVCKMVRRDSSVPIIMLTAKKDETDRVLGLELGADDYVTKPFSIKELMARVKTILRRSQDKANPISTIHLGELTIDLERYEVKRGSKEIALSPKEFEFLKVLLRAQGKVLSREHLLESIWNYDQASEMDTRTIDQHVARLRGKLGAEGQHIVTVKNVGYRLKTDGN